MGWFSSEEEKPFNYQDYKGSLQGQYSPYSKLYQDEIKRTDLSQAQLEAIGSVRGSNLRRAYEENSLFSSAFGGGAPRKDTTKYRAIQGPKGVEFVGDKRYFDWRDSIGKPGHSLSGPKKPTTATFGWKDPIEQDYNNAFWNPQAPQAAPQMGNPQAQAPQAQAQQAAPQMGNPQAQASYPAPHMGEMSIRDIIISRGKNPADYGY